MLGPIKESKGKPVGWHKAIKSIQGCMDLCTKNEKCKSFLYGTSGNCALKDKQLNGSEPLLKKNKDWYSVYVTCEKGNIRRLKLPHV